MNKDQFDIESVPFVPGPDITNEELATIALTLYQLANTDLQKNKNLSAWEVDARTNYDRE